MAAPPPIGLRDSLIVILRRFGSWRLWTKRPSYPHMLPDSLLPLLEALKTVPGIRAIVVGGSRARGSDDAVSDTDLGLYYDAETPLAIDALDRVVAEHDDRKQSGLVTAIGGWGPWINGGGWLQVSGAAVDILYRDTSAVESVISQSIAGQFEMVYRPGHPFGFLSSIYAGEVAICDPFWDPVDWVANNKSRLIEYPSSLRRELVRHFGFEAKFSILIAEKPAKRSDISYVAGCLFQMVGSLLMVLFAINRIYWLNEKGALRLTDRFQIVPARFRERVEGMWESVRKDPDSLEAALGIARKLNEEVMGLVEREGLTL